MAEGRGARVASRHSLAMVSCQQAQDAATSSELWGSTHRISAWADLQFVTNPSASGTHALHVKQMGSLAVPFWTPMEKGRPEAESRGPVQAQCGAGEEDEAQEGPTGPVSASKPVQSVQCYLLTADQGRDQAAMRRAALVDASQRTDVQLWSLDCLMHQSHLATETHLLCIDGFLQSRAAGWTYFSSLAKLNNAWRANAKRVYNGWVQAYGHVSAGRSAFSLPSRVLAGRWGSGFDMEGRLLDIGDIGDIGGDSAQGGSSAVLGTPVTAAEKLSHVLQDAFMAGPSSLVDTVDNAADAAEASGNAGVEMQDRSMS